MVKLIQSNKKIIITLFYTFLVFSIPIFSDYKDCNSRYLTTSDYTLSYQNDLDVLYAGDFISTDFYKSRSDKNFIAASYTFPRNSIGLNNTDKYIIDLTNGNKNPLPSSCDVYYNNNLLEDKTITFKENDLTTSNITVIVKCPVDMVTDVSNNQIVMPLTIKEKINNEDEFIYRFGLYNKLSRDTFDSYFEEEKPKGDFEINKEEVSGNDEAKENISYLYDSLINWFKENYYEEYIDNVYSKESTEAIKFAIEDYLSVYKGIIVKDGIIYRANQTDSGIEVKEPLDITSIDLLGISVTYDDATSKFSFKVLNNFIGYARTEDHVKSFSKSNLVPYHMYFSTTEDLNTIFKQYLNKYADDYFKDEADAIKIIEDYLNDLPQLRDDSGNYDISKFILRKDDSIEVDGLDYKSQNLIDINRLLTHAKNYKKSPIYVEVGGSTDNPSSILNVFKNKINKLYGNLVSTSVIDDLTSTRSDVAYRSIIRNNSVVYKNPVSFNNYHMVYDEENSNYLLINVYSSEDFYLNFININLLSVENDLGGIKMDEILFENSTEEVDGSLLNELKITLSLNNDLDNTFDDNKTKIESFIESLNSNFSSLDIGINIPINEVSNEDGTFTNQYGNDKATVELIEDDLTSKTSITFTISK